MLGLEDMAERRATTSSAITRDASRRISICGLAVPHGKGVGLPEKCRCPERPDWRGQRGPQSFESRGYGASDLERTASSYERGRRRGSARCSGAGTRGWRLRRKRWPSRRAPWPVARSATARHSTHWTTLAIDLGGGDGPVSLRGHDGRPSEERFSLETNTAALN